MVWWLLVALGAEPVGGVVGSAVALVPPPFESPTLGAMTYIQNAYVMRHEVTQAQWEAVMGNRPSHFQGCPDCPVENVSWEEAVAFAEAVSAAEGRTDRLPTVGDLKPAVWNVRDHRTDAWTNWDRPGAFGRRPRPVCTKGPQKLCDLAGNVAEWTATTDERGRVRVMGCSYRDTRDACSAQEPRWLRPEARRKDVGLRLVYRWPFTVLEKE